MIQENKDIELNVAEIFRLFGHAQQYSPGEIIFQKGDSTDKIYFVAKGRVRTYCLNERGDEITLFYIDENQLIGSEPLSNIQKRKISVDSVTNVQLYSMNANVFLEKCIKNKVSILNLMEFFINKIITLSNYICCNRFMKNNEKLAYFLYTNCAGDVVQYTHEQIALLTGMNRVSVTKLLNTFSDEKLISQHYKEIKILNMKGLASIFNSIGYFID